MQIAIIGGGAAGFFAAITAAETNPEAQVHLYERGKNVLEKVRISGGGRCNATHACFEARELVKNYPRGERELLGPFLQFGPTETIEWFEKRGVKLKTEADGRMFPVTDRSETIVQCLQNAARDAGVEVQTGARLENIETRADGSFLLHFTGLPAKQVQKIMIASGSSTAVWDLLARLGHTIVPPVPSLFTFNTKDTRLRDLSGVSAPNVALSIPGTKLQSRGPLLVTHWGLSGPAILRLSAWGARDLYAVDYKFSLKIDWLDGFEPDWQALKSTNAKKTIVANAQFGLPQRLWQNLTAAAGIEPTLRWADAGKSTVQALDTQLRVCAMSIHGKSTFKEEFVTAGGVDLKEINFKTFESKKIPGLYLVGEVLNIDAITGGFNFQAAWTGGFIAGRCMTEGI
ncbi:MAG: NAD(P)/FAD-dependent oxidoreductase [Saprospiraceae bacterium]|nr:NAD(P)/FAD-dependent oxidoreductase [Saprospiraceae bacterium]